MQSLHSLAPIRFLGLDAHSFLQGQLSNDLNLLSPTQSLLASCNSAQGRVQAILRLVQRQDGIIALLPRAQLGQTVARLQKYLLRAKLRIEDASANLHIAAATQQDLIAQGWPVPMTLGEHLEHEAISILRWPDPNQSRFLVLQPDATAATDDPSDSEWQLADIRAGLPQVLPETHEHFVAQMLNLDALGGISFNKGCYTGQEIIARAHFRGAVKRHMLRYASDCPAPSPGSRLLAGTEPAGEVVMASNTPGGCELLAVVSLSQQGLALTLETSNSAVIKLPLPYQQADGSGPAS